jgi:hypothetical protein
MIDLSTLNYGAIIVAGLVSFAIGAVWYSPLFFSKIWQKEVGLSNKELEKGNMFTVFGGSGLLMIFMSFALAVTIKEYDLNNDLTWQIGALKGLFFGVFFVLTSLGINMLYQRKSIRLFLIDGGYQVLFLTINGIILALWK